MLLGAWPVPMPQNRQDVAVVVMVSENVQFGRPCCSVLPMLVAIAVVSRRTFRVTRTGSVESVVRFGSFEEEGSIDFYGQSGAYCGLASLATCASFAIGRTDLSNSAFLECEPLQALLRTEASDPCWGSPGKPRLATSSNEDMNLALWLASAQVRGQYERTCAFPVGCSSGCYVYKLLP